MECVLFLFNHVVGPYLVFIQINAMKLWIALLEQARHIVIFYILYYHINIILKNKHVSLFFIFHYHINLIFKNSKFSLQNIIDNILLLYLRIINSKYQKFDWPVIHLYYLFLIFIFIVHYKPASLFIRYTEKKRLLNKVNKIF